ncbi:hypothetical protein [Phaeobacter sp. S60]|uniref:hypothetical protein n=1 Tax=Phaeobacter sp. S60 TaxID=1569353 RepID=UPI00058E1481|nr:hypothetical protein [Phaeobacter sp. S60]KII14887.1 hypothetical protein OO25_10955 [Phaeobacter sp. S60]
MSDNPNPELAGRGISIAIALFLIVFGVVISILPLLLPVLTSINPIDVFTFAPVAYWFGLVIALSGLSVLLARIIKIDAVGAGNMKFLGFELPIEVGGAIFVLFFLLLGAAAVSFGTGLHNFKDNRASIAISTEADALAFVRAHKEYARVANDLGVSESRLESAETNLAAMTGQRDALRTILQAGLDDRSRGVELMRMRIDCGDLGKHWIDWPERLPGDDEVRARLRPDPNAYVDPSDVEPFRVYGDRTTTYHLYAAGSTGSDNRIISFNLRLDGDNVLTGTFESTGRSLDDFCQSFSRGVRGFESDPLLTEVDRLAPVDPGAVTSETTIAAEAASDN